MAVLFSMHLQAPKFKKGREQLIRNKETVRLVHSGIWHRLVWYIGINVSVEPAVPIFEAKNILKIDVANSYITSLWVYKINTLLQPKSKW